MAPSRAPRRQYRTVIVTPVGCSHERPNDAGENQLKMAGILTLPMSHGPRGDLRSYSVSQELFEHLRRQLMQVRLGYRGAHIRIHGGILRLPRDWSGIRRSEKTCHSSDQEETREASAKATTSTSQRPPQSQAQEPACS